jgi:hypothetical protein
MKPHHNVLTTLSFQLWLNWILAFTLAFIKHVCSLNLHALPWVLMVLWLHHISLPYSCIRKMVPSFHLGNGSNVTPVNHHLPHARLTIDTWSNTPSEGMVFNFRLWSILYIFIYVIFNKFLKKFKCHLHIEHGRNYRSPHTRKCISFMKSMHWFIFTISLRKSMHPIIFCYIIVETNGSTWYVLGIFHI